ncbi:MAG TPA: TlpA disulfide reductase family protein [Kofleriaceae bacterium]
MKLLDRIGMALVRPRAALALAGDRKHAGRSGSDLLLAILVLIVVTQPRALVAATWLGFAVDAALGVRALVQTLTDMLVIDLGFLVIGAAIIYLASGTRRELGRAFDFACVAVLPLLFIELLASVVVYAAQLRVTPNMMWAFSLVSYAWAAALVGLACLEARRPSQVGATPMGKHARRAGWGIVAVALASVVVQLVWVGGHIDRVRPMTPGNLAPQFALPRITGKDTLGEFVSLTPGKIHVIDFWATWCGPCLKAMPKLDALARAHPEVVVLAINIDDSAHAWELFAERNYGMTLLAGDRDTGERYGVRAIPHTVVIDQSGTVRRVFRGGMTNLDREVQALLK